MDERHALIIYNPAAGKGDPDRRREELERLALQAGWRGELVQTSLRESAGKLAAQGIRNGYRHIVVSGGDGTIMDLLPAIMGKDITLGVIPTGTGNLLALNLHIPLRLGAAVETALHGDPRQIAIGKANGHLFSIVAGIGFDAALIRDATPELKRKYGLFAYVVSMLRNLAHLPHRYTVSVDDGTPQTYVAKSILVANMGRLQGGVIAVPHADPETADLKIVIVRPESLLAWIGLILHALAGRIERHHSYTLLEGKRVRIRAVSGEQPVQCDGNLLSTSKHLFAEVAPEAVTIMRPRPVQIGRRLRART